MALEAITGQLQQLWRGREIPICIPGIDVTEIRGREREPRFWVVAMSICVQKGADGEPMAYVVKPRPARRGMRFQASAAHDGAERVPHITREEPHARGRDQQRG